MTSLTYVVLAAGAARRMGFSKAFEPIGGRSPVERIAATLGARPWVVVVPPDDADRAGRQAPGARIVMNGDPQRGMTHSLRLSIATFDGPFAVWPADMPFVQPALLETIESSASAARADVIYPAAPERPGHPVAFLSDRARAVIAALADGDTLSRARDDASLVREIILWNDARTWRDVDTPDQWNAELDGVRDR